MTDPNHIVDAFMHVATTNHYLVTVDESQMTLDELQAAEQILITRDNTADNQDPTLNLALDLCEIAIKAAMKRA